MARAVIETANLGRLPKICVKTGMPTENVRSQSFSDIPGWTLLLICWGVIPFLIAAVFARRKATVDLPASRETLRQLRAVDVASPLGLLAAILLLSSALATREGFLAWAGIAVAIITVVGEVIARNVIWVTGRFDGDALRLYGVHAKFARAVEPLAPRAVAADRVSTLGLMLALTAAAMVGLLLVWWFRPA